MKGSYLLLFLFFLFIISCKPDKADIDFSGLESLDQILQKQKKESKYVVLILTKSGCDLCDIYKKELNGLNNNKNAAFGSDLMMKSVEAKRENLWLNQLLREYSFPLTIVLDKEGDVRGFFRGARPEVLNMALRAIYSGKIYYESKAQFLNLDSAAVFSDEQKIKLIDELLKAFIAIRAGNALNNHQLAGVIRTVKWQPYFFNNYLLTKAMIMAKDTIQAQKLAYQTLNLYNEELDAILYPSLKNELRYLVNRKYKFFEDALITTPRTEINFGSENVGVLKTVRIPIRNVGKKPLIINSVKVSCDCLKVTWPHEPISPGKTGEITVGYKLKEVGAFNQSLFVFSSSPTEPLQINITGIAQII
ncbi:DUF1573 domain-containing protein [Pedobacter africanus]|uniref:Thioredoxin-related protein n=1 Tax=Pedobacter africanus TaxID=151894 RepID=A0A1W2AVG5_9SPHI|nr:DUF1573 domain-containing protein [Pedobacter africanus]SMC64727.1 Thioredoxin-related protein [Pedobacter africanus]